MLQREKGFTMVELILVIAILGILAIVALPEFIHITTQAKKASRDGVLGAVRSGIQLYRANRIVQGLDDSYPNILEGNGNSPCSEGNPCFGNVLTHPVTDESWFAVTIDKFSHNDGMGSVTYIYNRNNGAFNPE